MGNIQTLIDFTETFSMSATTGTGANSYGVKHE
jgi:hypothetical protein